MAWMSILILAGKEETETLGARMRNKRGLKLNLGNHQKMARVACCFLRKPRREGWKRVIPFKINELRYLNCRNSFRSCRLSVQNYRISIRSRRMSARSCLISVRNRPDSVRSCHGSDSDCRIPASDCLIPMSDCRNPSWNFCIYRFISETCFQNAG